VRITGEDWEKTILTYDDFAAKKNRFGEEIGTTGSTTFFVFGDGFRAENMTFENSSGSVGQAVAVRVDGDQVVFQHCRFLGFQDTLYPHGKRAGSTTKIAILKGRPTLFLDGRQHCLRTAPSFARKGVITLLPLQHLKGIPTVLYLSTAR
jgi:pectinesterase